MKRTNRTGIDSSLKRKVESAFAEYLRTRVANIDIVKGHEVLDVPPETCLLVWCQSVGLRDDMPSSTGVRVALLSLRVEIPEKAIGTMDAVSVDLSDAMNDVVAIRAFMNLGSRSPDDRPVRGFHVDDVDLTSNPDTRSEDYVIEEFAYEVLCGELDG